jgi:CheY-like chemotaxis protein
MKFKILVVDDDPTISEELKELLEEDQHEVQNVNSGEDALKIFSDQRFDIVFLDIKLPGMDGVEVLKDIKSKPQSPYIIMITGYATLETAIESMKSGAFDYISKPFDIEQIHRSIDSIIQEDDFISNLGRMTQYWWETRQNSFELFSNQLQKSKGLCLTKTHPKDLLLGHGIATSEFIYLNPELSKDALERENLELTDEMIKLSSLSDDASKQKEYVTIHPQNLFKLKQLLSDFIERSGDETKTVIFNGIEILINQHTWENFLKFITTTTEMLNMANSRLVISVDPHDMKRIDFINLKRFVSRSNVDMIADSLSNVLRRGIIQILADKTTSNFSTFLKLLEVDDSGKLGFHLRKLISDGIIKKDKELYSLTERGLVASNILSLLEEKGAQDVENVITMTI